MSIDPSAWQLTLQEQLTQSLHDSLLSWSLHDSLLPQSLQEQCTQSLHDDMLSQSLLAIALGQRLTHAEGTAALMPTQ